MDRLEYIKRIIGGFRIHPVCALLGPRQVGKTTLAKMYTQHFTQQKFNFFDLENPLDLAKLENPILTFSRLAGELIVIDEVQRAPNLFPLIRVLVDDHEKKLQFLILGSASRDLINHSSESLAGRIGHIEIKPFSLEEAPDVSKLWLRGGFPRSYLASSDEDSLAWRQDYILTFLERDIPQLGIQIPPSQMRRFWLMLAHYHGQIFNASELGKSLGVSDHTIRKYLDILVGTFMIRRLCPWFENLGKRQVKSPKIYFRDSGILHALIGLGTEYMLQTYPKLGSLWEGFALEEVIAHFNATNEEVYFWATASGAELDLLIVKDGKRIGCEIKYTDFPKITQSMRIAEKDLNLDHLYVIYPGIETFPLSEKITAVGLDHLKSLPVSNKASI